MFPGDVLQWNPCGLGCLEGEGTGVWLDLELRNGLRVDTDWQGLPGQQCLVFL